MLNLPTPKLGEVTAITITSPDLENSSAFYKRLGFTELIRFDFPLPFILMSDGAMLIMLRKGNEEYIALTYYTNNQNKIVDAVENAGISFFVKPNATDVVKRYVIKSPDGLSISLVNNVENFFKQPEGPTMLNMDQSDYFNPDKYANETCGMFGEFAHPVKDLEVSISFWEKLGFTALSKMTTPYPWAIISDGLAVVGLHQTDNFSYPAITFFAADMKEKIEKLKVTGLQNFVDKGNGSIVITTPENQHINLFKMGK